MVGLMGFGRGLFGEYALNYGDSQEDKWLWKSELLQTQMKDLRLKWGILNGRAKNTISGSYT
jgi:hypothetical protein